MYVRGSSGNRMCWMVTISGCFRSLSNLISRRMRVASATLSKTFVIFLMAHCRGEG